MNRVWEVNLEDLSKKNSFVNFPLKKLARQPEN